MHHRKPALRLSRETVRELSGNDLRDAAGGLTGLACLISELLTGIYPSINAC